MQFMNKKVLSVWQECVQEALLEVDQQAFRKKLEIARTAIESRLVELEFHASPDPTEQADLSANLNTIYALKFLTSRAAND